MRNFRELRVWQDSIELASLVYEVTKDFPKEEVFGMTRQIRRSVVSIASNIAEGCSRTSNKEFCHFLEISVGSAYEAETQLIISKRASMLSEQKTEDCLAPLHRLEKQITQLIKIVRGEK